MALQSNPNYESTSMSSFSGANFEGFPAEMLPIRMEVQRGKSVRRVPFKFPSIRQTSRSKFLLASSVPEQQDFTSSFIAGAYRDTRMGITELRAKRMDRLRRQQEIVAAAQLAVAKEVPTEDPVPSG